MLDTEVNVSFFMVIVFYPHRLTRLDQTERLTMASQQKQKSFKNESTYWMELLTQIPKLM